MTLLQIDACVSEEVFGEGKIAPRYSSYIALAWEVAQRMNRRGFHFLLSVSRDGLSTASFYTGPQDTSEAIATDASAPMAICLAALRAVGVEVSA